MTKLPWAKFYFSDWRSDPCLRMCSLAARGLWMEMLAIMHEAKPLGSLVINSKEVTIDQLAKLAGCTALEAESLCLELEEAGVFSRKKNGVIYSRRMEKDENRARKNRENGKLGGNPTLSKETEKEQSLNPLDNDEVKAQKLEARSYKEREEDIEREKTTQEIALPQMAKPLKKGSRLPDDWFPNPLSKGFLEENPFTQESLKREFQKFRNYWQAKAGAGAIKLDWNSTWRNWLLNNYSGNQNGRQSANDKSSGQRFFDKLNEKLDERERSGSQDDDYQRL